MDLHIELRTIRIMLAIEQAGSFAKASELLYISQPALTQYIQRIEAQLSYPLYKRQKGKCIPTEAGKILLTEGKTLLDQYVDMTRKMENVAKPTNKTIKFGWPAGYTLQYLQKITSDEAEFNLPSINITEDSVENLTQQLLDKKLDFLLLPALYSHPNLVYETIRHEEFYLAVPENHVANSLIDEDENSKFATLSKFKDMPFISVAATAYKEFLSPIFHEAGFRPNNIFVCNNWDSSNSLVETGLGLSIVPYWFSEKQNNKVNYYHIKSKFPTYRIFAFAYNKTHKPSKEVEFFIKYFKENFGDEFAKEPFEYLALKKPFK